MASCERRAAALLAFTILACGVPADQLRRAEAAYANAGAAFREGNVPGALQYVQESIGLNPDDPDAHYLLGLIHSQRGDYDAARSALRDSLRLQGADTESEPSLRPETLNLLGVVLVLDGDPAAAVPLFEEAAEDPAYRTPYLALGNLAWAHLEREAVTPALEAAGLSVRLQPDFCIGWYRLAQAQQASGDPTTAEESVSRALDVEAPACQANQAAWRLRGELLLRLARPEEATEALERCVELADRTDDGAHCRELLDRDVADGGAAAP